jgi:hypothetical protein
LEQCEERDVPIKVLKKAGNSPYALWMELIGG